MALAANSYGSVAEVEALVRHLLDGGLAFSQETTPTKLEVEAIVNRVSGVLNTALAANGFSIPLSDATAVLACAEWVIKWSIIELRHAYPHLGISEEEDQPSGDIFQAAYDFVNLNTPAFKNLEETVDDALSKGLVFTAQNKHSIRTDPDNTSYEQPMFRRRLFDA